MEGKLNMKYSDLKKVDKPRERLIQQDRIKRMEENIKKWTEELKHAKTLKDQNNLKHKISMEKNHLSYDKELKI